VLQYKLFAVNLTGVPLVRFSTCSTANRGRWILRVYRGLISAERTVAAVMDGLGVRCDSANLRLLSQVYRNKIERKFLVPHSIRKGEKSAIQCGTAKCHFMCQVCLPALLKFDSFPLNERSDIARYCQPFFYTIPLPSFQPHYRYDFLQVISRCVVILWVPFRCHVKTMHSSCSNINHIRYVLFYLKKINLKKLILFFS